jgi:hypothetical protein
MGRNLSSDRGATLVMVTAALLMLFGVAAMAVDLSALRGDIRADRLAADAAATAGAAHIDPFASSQADEACQVAWEYLLINLGDEGTPNPPNCSIFASACDAATARSTTASAGPYGFVITHPVPDGHPLMSGQAIDPDIDGASCQRLGVEVERVRDYTFAPVLGFESGSTEVASVARIGAGVGEGEVVPLLVLEPTSCNALYTSGQGGVTVTHYQDSPGLIVVDSDANGGSGSNACSANRYAIDAQGNTNGWIRALPVPAPDNIPSAILSYALSGRTGTNPARAYDPADLTSPATGVDPSDPPETWFRLYPEPQPVSRRITRAPIDWRYNCKSSYSDYLGWIPIDPCPLPTAAHIDALRGSYGTNIAPAGFEVWTADSGEGCMVGSDVAVTGDWYVDCPGGFVVQDVSVTFSGGDVVFEGDVDVRASGSLTVNPGGVGDRIVYIRNNGDLLKRAQSSISLEHTFVYMENGRVDLVGGSGGLVWTAPLAGNFEDLALWAEADVEFQIGGQAGNSLTGTFFTPLSNPFSLTGQGGQFQTDAQFLTRRLEVKGQGEVRMRPDPDRQTLIPIREVRLIR